MYTYININIIVWQVVLWYNNDKLFSIRKDGVRMLFCDIIDLVFMGSGVLIGMIIATGLDMLKCDNCRRREENER